MNELGSNILVKSTKSYRNLLGQKVVEEPHFNEMDNTIYMDKNVDDYEYAETFKHKLGHFIDKFLRQVSADEQFMYALQADLAWYQETNQRGIATEAEMLTELHTSSVIDNRYISDILSGLFFDSERVWTMVERTYDTLGVAIYGHDTSYWKEITGPEKAIEGEVFADLFAIYAENDSKTIQFVERWFPNLTSRFKGELERVGV